ncbi:ABC transporter permease/substrate-binding protein [Sphingomonas floccifaciens]|uniref:ABC transporter permease/substrate-binding protein n=1 Tax=Sphingomonas floccifaciens TaxID=1844115 RepID=A0ABW4NDB2_9SPHN
MTAAFARVPELLASHLLLSFAALLLGLALALPMILLAARHPAVARVALGFASLVQTIPALALLALFFPLLLWLGLPPLGFLPSLLALSLYALLPILRNGVTGLAGIDPAVREAADGVGMTARQKLLWVEAPLVLPVLMAGIRTAAVWTIGAATLATTVGQPSLGDLIFSGLQTQSWPLVLAGCIASAGLALAVDALLGLAERGVATRRRWLWMASLALLAVGAGAAALPRLSPARPTVVVGAKNFSEQFILARLIGARLRDAGYDVAYREGLGSAVAYGALKTGTIDVYVDYAGTIWASEMKRAGAPSAAQMLPAIARWAKDTGGVRLLGPLGFENAYAFAMRADEARAAGIATLDDLARASPRLRLASDLEFLDRPEWAAVRRAYPMRFGEARAYAPSFMYQALASGRADVISAFSSDGRIAADRLVVLSDPRGAIPRYDAILLLSPKRAGDTRFIDALRPLLNAIPVAAMREANYLVDRDTDKRSPDDAARWLATRIDRRP